MDNDVSTPVVANYLWRNIWRIIYWIILTIRKDIKMKTMLELNPDGGQFEYELTAIDPDGLNRKLTVGGFVLDVNELEWHMREAERIMRVGLDIWHTMVYNDGIV